MKKILVFIIRSLSAVLACFCSWALVTWVAYITGAPWVMVSRAEGITMLLCWLLFLVAEIKTVFASREKD